MPGSGISPCAACKLLRRKCAKDCVFAPYFPADQPHKFACVHKIFGASNVNKMLQDLPLQQRGDAVSSMVYEANARVIDPVYGCAGVISSLQQQIAQLQTQLTLAHAEILCIRMHQAAMSSHLANNEVMDVEDPSSPHTPQLNQFHYKPLMPALEPAEAVQSLWRSC
ncbi:hypothetical protein O6H91_01G082500 [Diphasiastrum complanatum]|uniref:Uncharacterized protein n=1 Tax=Diphasiastrum complanatum TaxID=34168 RepID=A0ACC2ET00_DIPCM|nr:hypothetical protein O6H91_01G082500 [Diphasiastrum complanatum]